MFPSEVSKVFDLISLFRFIAADMLPPNPVLNLAEATEKGVELYLLKTASSSPSYSPSEFGVVPAGVLPSGFPVSDPSLLLYPAPTRKLKSCSTTVDYLLS